MRRIAIIIAVAALTACQVKPGPTIPPAQNKSAALLAMEQVAIAANKCWFQSKDPAFAKYSFANELNSMTGRPRFLLVPKGNYGGRPLLVVQAEGPAGRVTTFGPLLDGPTGGRIRADIERWTRGPGDCGSAA